MEDLRYLKNVSTLSHNPELCIGCRMCEIVCPHQIFVMENKKAKMTDKDACMECGACVLNCESGAIDVTPGVGCAAYIISSWINGKENASCDCG
ncbi:4Fe-4S binding protein [bacterium]|nr:4Fe-4S binding protein [bacterium]